MGIILLGQTSIRGVVFDGDSLTAGGGATDGSTTDIPHATWFQTITGIPTSNIAVGGRTIQTCAAAFAANGAPLYGATRSHYVVLIGANNTDDANTMFSALSGLCSAARNAGFKVWICTAIPRAGYSSSANLVSYDGLIRSSWNTIADGYVEFGQSFFSIDGHFTIDGEHQTVRAAIRMADTVRQRFGLPYTATDATPDAFSFTDITGVTKSTPIVSNVVELAGLTAPATFSVTGGTLVVNGVDQGTSGTVQPYDNVQAKGTSSGSNTTAVNVAVTIGGVLDTFTITTGSGVMSAINWDNPVIAGSGAFSNTDHTFTPSADFSIKSSDSTITGKKVFAVQYNANGHVMAGTYAGAGVSSTAANANGLNADAKSLAVYCNSWQFNGDTSHGQLYLSPGDYVGFIIDVPNSKLWYTKDNVRFNSFTLKLSEVVAGTSAVDISTITAGGSILIWADSVLSTGSGTQFTLMNYWPWDMPTGYSYLGAT